jgi:hypothetical protein
MPSIISVNDPHSVDYSSTVDLSFLSAGMLDFVAVLLVAGHALRELAPLDHTRQHKHTTV